MRCDKAALLQVHFTDQPGREATPDGADPAGILAATRLWLEDYFSGRRPEPSTLPLKPEGTLYQQSVWRMLLRVGYGQRRSYGDLCRALAFADLPPGSPRAAGDAVGRNPIAIIIPCHRILGASGKLVGFAAGLWRKEWLLNHEAKTR